MSAARSSTPAAAQGGPPRWGMVVDINRCVGCQTCVASCKHANDTTPGVQWRRVIDVEIGHYPSVERLFLVTGCQHCAEPPCVPVCPTGATRQRADGLVTMDYDLCIGCAACAVACPYQARTIVHDAEPYYPGAPTVQEEAVARPERLGVAQKCTFCVEKVDRGLEDGMRPGVDFEATPACASSCIAQAIHFGDFNDSDSNVSRLVRDNKSFRMHEELGTRPFIHYLYETPAVPGRDPLPSDHDDEALADLENPLVGQRQQFWDIRAAANFILGGMGAGLAVIASLLGLLAGLAAPATLWLLFSAGALMAIGLVCVFFKIGRKLRFLYALRRPQSSWMTREVYAAAAFYSLLAADLARPAATFHALVGLAALGFLYCQARILFASKGVPAWRAPLIPALLVTSGLYEGVGLAAIGLVLLSPIGLASGAAAAAGVTLALINANLWRRYRGALKDNGAGPLARRALASIAPPLQALGYTLPVLAYLSALFAGGAQAQALMLIAGGLAAASGVLWKYAVIVRAGHQQGFALPKLPQRGSGARAAPPAFPARVAAKRAPRSLASHAGG